MDLQGHRLWVGTHITHSCKMRDHFNRLRPHLLTSRRCSTTEQDYRAAAQNLVNLGLATLGYQYVNLYVRLDRTGR